MKLTFQKAPTARRSHSPAVGTTLQRSASMPSVIQAVPLQLQTKLTVNTPGDRYEQEADRVAEQVMRMPEPQVQRQCACGKNSTEGECSECEKKKQPATGSVQRAATSSVGGIAAPPIVERVLNSSGSPLPNATRTLMESRFGHDLSHVRVHTDQRAIDSAAAVKAKAYTVGNKIVFGRGEGPTRDPRLLAHELTHVLQQHGTSPRNEHSERSLMRTPLFNSTFDIEHNYLRSRTFRISEGGLVVAANGNWEYPEWEGEDSPACGPTKYSIDLRKEGYVFDSSYGSCEFSMGNPTSRYWTNLPEGDYHLGINAFDHNPICVLRGVIDVSQQSGLAGDSCTKAPPGPLEILHAALDAAGLIPALGAIPDAANAAIYSIEGDWANAGFSAAAIVPFLGEAATLSKALRRGRDAVRVTARGAETLGVEGVGQAIRRARAAAAAERTTAHAAANAAELINRLRVPRSIPYRSTTAVMDPRLTELARELRATQAGVSEQALRSNIATARVRVDGRIEYLSAANAPSAAHSEEYIHSQIVELRRSHQQVSLEQLYSERIPCTPNCGPLLGRSYPGTQVYYTTRATGGEARIAELMQAYGIGQ